MHPSLGLVLPASPMGPAARSHLYEEARKRALGKRKGGRLVCKNIARNRQQVLSHGDVAGQAIVMTRRFGGRLDARPEQVSLVRGQRREAIAAAPLVHQ